MIYLGNQAVGVAVGVGKFTQYEKKTAVGAGNSNTLMQISISFDPKLVLFSGGTDETGHIISGVMDFTNTVGAALYRNSSSSAMSTSGYRPQYTDSAPAANATQFKYYNGTLYMSRANANGFFASTDTFTFEIYG